MSSNLYRDALVFLLIAFGNCSHVRSAARHCARRARLLLPLMIIPMHDTVFLIFTMQLPTAIAAITPSTTTPGANRLRLCFRDQRGRVLAMRSMTAGPSAGRPSGVTNGASVPIDIDMQYIDHWSLGRDFNLILKTVPLVLAGEGAGLAHSRAACRRVVRCFRPVDASSLIGSRIGRARRPLLPFGTRRAMYRPHERIRRSLPT
jgi:hypothetical protein